MLAQTGSSQNKEDGVWGGRVNKDSGYVGEIKASYFVRWLENKV